LHPHGDAGGLAADHHQARKGVAEEDGDLDWQNINLTAAFVAR
jgi:hypothetical protein